MRSPLLRIILSAIITLAGLTAAADAQSASPEIPGGTYSYLETRGDRSEPFLWHLSYVGTVVEIRLADPLSMFWHGTYWYRLHAGLFLQFKSDVGPAKSMSRSFVLAGKVDT
mgnify:CR=1 FL=1